MRVFQRYPMRRIFRLVVTVFTALLMMGCVFTPASSQSTPVVVPVLTNTSNSPSAAANTKVEPQSPAPAASPTYIYLPLVTMEPIPVTPPPPPPPGGDYKNIIFLHHSTGRNLIQQGGVRKAMHDLGYEFWDHDYNDLNQFGLNRPTTSDPFFERTGTNYNIPDDNTDIYLDGYPQGLKNLFAQPLITTNVPPLPQPCTGSNLNAFTCLMRHKVIIIKSCYPNANVISDQRLEEYKQIYIAIADRAAQYPDHIFITLGFPPLYKSDPGFPTTSANAQRARQFINWLKSDAIVNSKHPNFYVYDIFDQLAGSDNFLKEEYKTNTSDSHPNEVANAMLGPKFVQFVDQAIKDYSASGN